MNNILEETSLSDKPESDQHFHFPIIRVHGPDDEAVYDQGDIDNEIELTPNISHGTSLESDTFYSDLVFSETPSPVGFIGRDKHRVDDWRQNLDF